jgi:twitching motility protein PilT
MPNPTNSPDLLLAAATKHGASDLLLSPGSPPAVRAHGVIHPLGSIRLTAQDVEQVMRVLVGEERLHEFERRGEMDFPATYGEQRLRGSAYLRDGAPALVLRLIPAQIPTPAELGLPPVIAELAEQSQGLILFTGASGQGKSTSQAALVDMLNRKQALHIVTIEDPIEFVHPPHTSIVDQREVGNDTTSFAQALKHVMRQNPDVILIGEMRDLETIQAAMNVAETGHLVMSTLHANDACQAVDRIVYALPPGSREQVQAQLSLVLLAVVNQRLVRDRYARLVLAAEVLLNTPAIAKLIREGKTAQLYNTMEIQRQGGMQTMNHALEALVAKGVVAPNEAQRYMIRRESKVL